jgi:hypothetical protein
MKNICVGVSAEDLQKDTKKSKKENIIDEEESMSDSI